MQEKETQQIEQHRESEVDVCFGLMFQTLLRDELMKLNTSNYDDKEHNRGGESNNP